ncbi:toxin TcdB middle/N-terminal domain-containing protein [Sphingopyxis panaciterrae]
MRADSGAAAGVTGLPQGGVSPLGDRFQPDLMRGSGTFSVPLPMPLGAGQMRPDLKLDYGTGSGNGPFGLGWRLELPRIERRTDRGMPTYTDADSFVLGGAEVLVDVGGGRFRPRVDTLNWLIERDGDGWRIKTGTGSTLFLGTSAETREEDGGRIFAWLIEREIDPAGNEMHFDYERRGGRLLVTAVRWSVFSLAIEYEARPDVVRNGRAGFLRTLDRRAKSIALHSRRAAPTLLRTYTLDYESATNGCSLLARVSLAATRDAKEAALPPLTFAYSRQDLTAWEWRPLTGTMTPPSIDDAGTQFVDMTGDGLPDLLHDSGSALRLWRNVGDGHFEGPALLGAVPAALRLADQNVAFADLNGNGRADLFVADQPFQFAVENDGHGGFSEQVLPFALAPDIGLASPQSRLTDIDGDGVTDLIATARDHIVVHHHTPGTGWTGTSVIDRQHDLDQFPDVSFGDRGVRLADMTGDGLQDMVLIRSGDASYWPNLGDGRFGARVLLDAPPVFPANYREDRLLLLDIDGDGCADLVYCGDDGTTIWLNRSGTGFGAATELPVAIARRGMSPIAIDLFGDGMTSLVWAEPSAAADAAGAAALRFDGGTKPHLLTAIDNGMGGVTAIEYASTTAMRIADLAAGRVWEGSLPFAVPVVAAIDERDNILGSVRRTEIRYRDGVYDGIEREFRGFADVEQTLVGDESAPTLRQHYHYFQGEPEMPEPRERQRQRALGGSLTALEIYEAVDDGEQLRLRSAQVWEAALLHDGPDGFVFVPRLLSVEQRELGDADPDRIERTLYSEHDAAGNVGRKRRSFVFDGQPESEITSDERSTFVAPSPAWLVKLVVREEVSGANGVERLRETHYDGDAFTGLPLGEAMRGLPTRIRELHLSDAALPVGYLGDRDMAADGFEREAAGGEPGWYATPFRVRRDGHGNIVEQRDALGHPTLIVFDGDGLYPTEQVNAAGHRVTYAFDPVSGEPASISASDGRATRYVCDPLGRPAAQYERDDAGDEQLVAVWDAAIGALPVATLSWLPRTPGLTPESARDPAHAAEVQHSRIYFNGFGERAQEICNGPAAADGSPRLVSRHEVRQNARGMVAATFADRFVTTFDFAPQPVAAAEERTRYDANGHMIERVGPGTSLFRTERDTSTVVRFEGAADAPVKSRTESFDAQGRIRRIAEWIEPDVAAITSYELTLDGRIAAVLDGEGKTRIAYHYGAAGDAIRIVSRDAGTRDYHRDAAGRIVVLKLADGKALHYAYDPIGRPTAIKGGGATLRHYEYADAAVPNADFTTGRLTAIVEPDSRIDYRYTRLGRTRAERVSVGGDALEVQWEYGHGGDVTAIVHPDGARVEQTLDSAGRVTAIDGVVDAILYDADDAVESYRLANGVTVTTTREDRRVTALDVARGGTPLRTIGYGRDAIGGCTEIRDAMPGDLRISRFSFDGARRVTAMDVVTAEGAAPVQQLAYGYDAIGNIRANGETGATMAYADAARPERLTGLDGPGGARSFGYDARGHTTDLGDGTTLTFDLFDRLVRAERAGGPVADYVVDPLGRVAGVDRSGGGTNASMRAIGSLFEQHAAFALRHIYLAGRAIATIRSAPGEADRTAYQVSDHQGSVLIQIDDAGEAIAQQRYTPYGLAIDDGSALDRYLGIEREASMGIQRVGARIYSASLGRFVSPDWYILENPTLTASVPQGFNIYSYAVNNPVDFKDPTGRFFFIVAAVVAAVGFTVGFVSGLARGKSFGESLLIGLETALTTTIGAALGAATGFLVGGPAGAIFGGIMGGINGLYTGARGIYDWGGGTGFIAFLADSTWGLLGTSLGNLSNIYNSIAAPGSYLGKYSERQNRQVYDRGFSIDGKAAFTAGNVISNMRGRSGTDLLDHETLHITQSRIFGPIYQITYVAWLVVGAIVGLIASPFVDQSVGQSIRDMAYSNNPWERWGYHVGGGDGRAGELKW